MKFEFELKGEMPLLMHADDIIANDALVAWRKKPENQNVSKPGDDRSPSWTWRTYLYSDGRNIAIPSQNIMVAIRKAGTQIIMKKQKTFKEVSQSGLLIESEFCDFLIDGKQVPIEPFDYNAMIDKQQLPFDQEADRTREHGFKLLVKRAAVDKKKHVRVRPRFDKWMIRGTVAVLCQEINEDTLRKLFELAGGVGIGDWRPGSPKSPGPYGMFSASLKKIR